MTERTVHEQKMCAILESGAEPRLADVGSIDEFLSCSDSLGRSPLLPEFVRLAVSGPAISVEGEKKCWSVVEACVPLCESGSAFFELVDLVDKAPEGEFRSLCEMYLRIFDDKAKSPVLRAASLDGAFRFVFRESQLRFALISRLLATEAHDDRDLIRPAAKIMGAVHAIWPEPELLDKLVQLRGNRAAIDQVAFEIGSCKMQLALDSQEVASVERGFHEARYWFSQSVCADNNRHDAAIYLEAIDCLLSCCRGDGIELDKVSAALKKHLTFLRAWNRSNTNPPWLADETVQLICWDQLGRKLTRLSAELLQPSWYETAVVVEDVIAAAWTASRSVLHRVSSTGLEVILRPKIEGGIAAKVGQAHQIKEWLRRNSQHIDADTVKEIDHRVDAIVMSDSTTPKDVASSLDEVILHSGLAQPSLALRAIRDAYSVAVKNLTVQEERVIQNCLQFVNSHPDYQNQIHRQLFNAVLLWTVRFLQTRLDMTKKDEPSIGYLFKQAGGTLAKEDALQTDYKNVMSSILGGTGVEVTNVAGGRADVLFRLETEHIVTEVKREQRDSSFESLTSEYSNQAADYQNVSGRLGFVLVLDQTTHDSGTLHISSLVKATELARKGESVPRMLVFVKVPGERVTPSELTKLAKKSGADRRRRQKKKPDGAS